MADIELVIKIPEEWYQKNYISMHYFSKMWLAIKNGTPLEDYCESCIYKPTESEDD